MRIIDSNGQADELADALRREVCNAPEENQFIAVDTEFIRENLTKPLLCLIQLATPNEIYIIDAISIDLSFLSSIFEDETIKKVFHSAQQDIEILSVYGINTKNFYDTQLYEMVLSARERISYQSIVFKYLGKRLKKGYSMSNWGKRPLSKKQLKYSTDDVFYLREVYKKQVKELSRLGRLNWLDDELQQLAKNENESIMPRDFRDEKDLHIFNQLVKWREKKAVEKNISPELIIKNEIIKATCKKGIGFIRNMKNSRDVKSEYLKEFLAFAGTISDLREIDEKPTEKNTSLILLKAILEICSHEENIAQSVIAIVRDLEKLSNGNKDISCLSGWRYEIFGKRALALLNGDILLHIKNSRAEIEWKI